MSTTSATETHYDLVIIGAGPAGTPVAIEYGKLNSKSKIALIDSEGKLGGECLFQGCIPSKIMEASSQEIKMMKALTRFGFSIKEEHYDQVWEEIKQRKEQILNKRFYAAESVVNTLDNVDLIKADASFKSDKILMLQTKEGSREISFDKALIATGSHSFIPPYKGTGVGKIWTNNTFFAEMERPVSLSIIGTGAIAVEFAMILSELDVEINLFGRKDKILSNIDTEAASFLLKRLQENPMINMFLNADITRVDFEDDIFEISYMQESVEKKISSHRVLSAAGRVANIASLNLENAGVEVSKKGIIVSKHLQTSNPHIYANGDVVDGFPKFAHTAQFAAHTIAQNLFLEHNLFSVDYDINSWVLFSSPNIMMAGLSEAEARQKGIDVVVDTFDFATEAKSQIKSEDYGYLKFVVEKSSKKIVGISMMHEEAHSAGGEAALIVANGMTLKDVISSIHPHPTISEAYVMLAKQMMGAMMLEMLKKPVVQNILKIERWI